MTAFNKGDKVKYDSKGQYSRIDGLEAEVVEQTLSGSVTANVTKSNGNYFVGEEIRVNPRNLTLIEEPIKVGDMVVVDLSVPGSAWHKAEGKVLTVLTDGYARLELTKPSKKIAYYVAGDSVTLGNLTKLEEPTLKEGDRVTVDQSFEPHGGKVFATRKGTIKLIDTANDYVGVVFDEDGGYRTGTFSTKFIVRLEEPKPFSFKDIQAGDTIRRTKTYKNGTIYMMEGVASYKGSYYWSDKSSYNTLAFEEDDSAKDITLELVNRPEPEPKKTELWEDRKVGDQLALYNKDGGLNRVFTKRSDDRWDTLVLNTSGKMQKGFQRSNTELASFLKTQPTDRKLEKIGV